MHVEHCIYLEMNYKIAVQLLDRIIVVVPQLI